MLRTVFTPLCLALILPSLVLAQSFPDVLISIAWDAPTQFSDGTQVLPGDIAGYLVCAGVAPIDPSIAGCGPHFVEPIPDGDAVSVVFSYTPHAASGTIYLRVRAVDQGGFEGDFSNEIIRPFVVSQQPPVGVVRLGVPGNLRSQ